MESLQAAIQAQPDLAEAHYQLGRLLAERGDTETARKSYGEALRLKPGYDEAQIALQKLGGNAQK